jgi:hypothetical protein
MHALPLWKVKAAIAWCRGSMLVLVLVPAGAV